MGKMGRPKKLNEIIVEGDIAKIICYRKGEAYEVLIDAEDVDRVKDRTWSLSHGYCVSVRPTQIMLHRCIMNAPKNMVVDHINGNKLDNRKSNLRICTHRQNSYNTKLERNTKSGRVGVNWYERDEKWTVFIYIEGKQTYLGLYDNLDEAIKVREEAEAKYFGEYARKE